MYVFHLYISCISGGFMRIFRFFANAAFIFGALLILNSCEVGLGESVDVTAPVLEISSPADGSIIMNTFKMRGGMIKK